MAQIDLADLHAQLVNLLASGEVISTIESMLDQPDQLANVAARSYVHPNGFRKLVIAFPESGTKLRLHHWAESETEPSNVHNHRWAFASAIVSGRLRSALFTVADSGEEIERYRFEPSQPGGQYSLSPEGVGRISVTNVAELGPGSTYALASEQLHQVRAKPNTLSLVLSGPAEHDRTQVFRPATLAPQPLNLPLLPIDDVRESLELLTIELQGLQWPAPSDRA